MNGANLIRAARGPILLISLGTLFALDHFNALPFERTWPLLIIIFGLLKLLERIGPQRPPQGGYPQ